MTTMNGKIVIAGNSIEELERELATVKTLIAMGKTYGVGGKSIEEVEDGLKMVGGTPPHCCCNYGCCEEEDEDLYSEEDEYYEKEGLYDEEEEDEYYEENDEGEDISELITDIIDKVKDLEDIIKR